MTKLTIIDVFTHDSRIYILFQDETQKEWLFFSHPTIPLRSLFFGEGFIEKIPKIRQYHSLCIECNLSSAIQGGVSLDGGDVIELQLTSKEANLILQLLSHKITELSQKDWKDIILMYDIQNWRFPEKQCKSSRRIL